jgi:hypothetical protein
VRSISAGKNIEAKQEIEDAQRSHE